MIFHPNFRGYGLLSDGVLILRQICFPALNSRMDIVKYLFGYVSQNLLCLKSLWPHFDF